MPSSRHRLGVALLLDEPVRSEVEGLRRAVGDPGLGRMAPHVTLVPPVNVHARDMHAALASVRSAAAAQPGPMVATLGPPATFLPHNPVLYLEVGGELERLEQLRNDVFRAPLARSLSWPWVPHVTIGDGVGERRIRAAIEALGDYAAAATFDRVVLLEERSGRQWAPIADACLAPPAVVGTGGMAVSITRGRLVDPEVRAAAGTVLQSGLFGAVTSEGDAAGAAPPLFVESVPGGRTALGPIVLTARAEAGVAGVAGAWVDAAGAHAGVFVTESRRRQGIGSHLLVHLESAAREAGWDFPVVEAEGPAAFYESRGAWARPLPPTGTRRRSSEQVS